jgi:ubiquinone/menaquinone biosynthesis C-methylase UbiE
MSVASPVIKIRQHDSTGTIPDEPAAALFQQQWQLYRKFVDHNLLYHREVYGELHRMLIEEVARPFRFLDIACGDASETVNALRGTQVAHYHGIDLSYAALDLASKNLEALDCPATLEHRDFVAALRDRPEPVDVAWIGFSLHHLLGPAKLEFMREVRSVVGDRGQFLIYETASPDGEDRDAWLLRWVRLNQPLWTALTLEEYEGMWDHVRAYDFPETTSRWHSLGREAGFGRVRELFVAPTDFFRMYCFQS